MYCISEFCRICINKNEELTNLHATDTDLITFYEKLKYCSSEIMDEDTELLNFICQKCMNNLRRTYDFLRLVRNTENALKGYMKTLENTVKSNESLKVLMDRNYKELKIIYPTIDDSLNISNTDRHIYDERSGIEIIKLQPVCDEEIVCNETETNTSDNWDSDNWSYTKPNQQSVDITVNHNQDDQSLLIERPRRGRPRQVEVVNHSQINNFNTSDFMNVNRSITQTVPNDLLSMIPPPVPIQDSDSSDEKKEHKLIYLPSRYMNKDTRRKCRWCYKKRSHMWGREWAMKCKKVCTMCDACGIFLCPPCFEDLHADINT